LFDESEKHPDFIGLELRPIERRHDLAADIPPATPPIMTTVMAEESEFMPSVYTPLGISDLFRRGLPTLCL
jgi:hypothetical protein